MPSPHSCGIMLITQEGLKSCLLKMKEETEHPKPKQFTSVWGVMQQPYTIQNGIAVVPILGEMLQHTRYWAVGYDLIKMQMEKAVEDPESRGVMLMACTPGGQLSGLYELCADIDRLKKIKPFSTYVDGYVCSAGYALAATTGQIYAPQMSQVGSIGVVNTHVDKSAFEKAMGVAITLITAGKYKGVGNEHSPLSADDKQYLQERVDEAYAYFVDHCATRMGLDANKSEEWAEGRVFHAEKAKELGLVSEIVTGLDNALELFSEEVSMSTINLDELKATNPTLAAQVEQALNSMPSASGAASTVAASISPNATQQLPAGGLPVQTQPAGAQVQVQQQGQPVQDLSAATNPVELAAQALDQLGKKDEAAMYRTLGSAFDVNQIAALQTLLQPSASAAQPADQAQQGGEVQVVGSSGAQILHALQNNAATNPVNMQPTQQSDAQKVNAVVDGLVSTFNAKHEVQNG